jgi:hypothetical protein
MIKSLARVLSCTIYLSLAVQLHAQMTGSYALAPIDSNGFDSTNRGNLNVHMEIPIFSKPGRGGEGFAYSLLYDGLIWSPRSAGWTPSTNWGWMDSTNVLYGYVTYEQDMVDCVKNKVQLFQNTRTNYVYHDSRSGNYPIGYSWTGPCGGAGTPTGTDTFSLGGNSGYTIYRNASSFSVFSRQGAGAGLRSIPTPPDGGPPTRLLPGSTTSFDTNGNSISASASGVFTDTTGHTVVTVTGSATPASPQIYTYTDSNGHSQTMTVSYTSYTVATNFGISGVPEFSATGQSLMSSITYSADGSTYYWSDRCPAKRLFDIQHLNECRGWLWTKCFSNAK